MHFNSIIEKILIYPALVWKVQENKKEGFRFYCNGIQNKLSLFVKMNILSV